MRDRSAGVSPMALARIAGLLYLIIFVMAPFAEFFVREGLIVVGDATQTAETSGARKGCSGLVSSRIWSCS